MSLEVMVYAGFYDQLCVGVRRVWVCMWDVCGCRGEEICGYRGCHGV